MNGALLPPVVVEVIAGVSGVIVSIGVPLILSKLNKIDKLHTTVFGLQEVSAVGGLIDDVEDNEKIIEELASEIESNEEKLNEVRECQEKIISKLESIEN